MRKSTAIVASLVAASSLAVALRIGELSTLSAIDLSVPSATSSSGATQTPEPGATATPQETPPAAPSPAAPAPVQTPVEITLNSDVIAYQYGNVQISLTKTDGTITAVTVIQGDATNGRGEAYVILSAATIEAQGTNYGNVSGATFTTDAFKLAVENVLAKF